MLILAAGPVSVPAVISKAPLPSEAGEQE
ncbi:Protein of unknown function [Pyronema omphalodes CBS 100304]|uniref:Uncharacterized protein n=1 Tax=Pyronema omphalodes (strain CBS 100304) TaxID=1076935 RepID=U4LGK0_PYROM|nr:Protein of unknown function [Pyronema omphalodes CBS 100304]